MSRRGRAGAPADEQLLEALDRLIEDEGIVEPSERPGVSDRTAANCRESRRVSRKMRGVLHKHLREQGEQHQAEVDAAREEQVPMPTVHDPRGGEEAGLQEPGHDLGREVEALRAEVVGLCDREDKVERRDG